MSSNVIQFPSVTHSTNQRKLHGHMTKTVYPIKDIRQIHALHRVLLQKAKSAASPSKARNAWRNWLFFALGINLGYRGGDITELTWDQLVTYDPVSDTYQFRNEENNYFHAEKTGKATFIVLNNEAKHYIEFYLNATKHLGILPHYGSPVFPSNKKAGTSEATIIGHIDCDNIGRLLKQAAKEAGITQSICTHSLRKTFGYHYYKETGDIITLQKIFGHSTPAITLTYIGIDAEEITAAYSAKPDTCIDDLETYLPTDATMPLKNAIKPIIRLHTIKQNPLIQYSPHRYTPQYSDQKVRALP